MKDELKPPTNTSKTIEGVDAVATSRTAQARLYVYDPSRCAIAYLRPMRCKDLAATGDAMKCQSIVEATLVVHNEKTAAKCKKCATD